MLGYLVLQCSLVFISGLRAEKRQFFNMINISSSQSKYWFHLSPANHLNGTKVWKLALCEYCSGKFLSLRILSKMVHTNTHFHTHKHSNRCSVLIRPLHRTLGLSCKLTCTCYVETNYTFYDKLHLVMVAPLLDLSVNVPCIYDRFQVIWILHCPHLYLASVFCFSLKTGRD